MERERQLCSKPLLFVPASDERAPTAAGWALKKRNKEEGKKKGQKNPKPPTQNNLNPANPNAMDVK